MRKAVAVLFILIFLCAIPGIVAGFRSAPSVSYLIGQVIFMLLMLILALHFWKPAPAKNKK